MWESPWVSSSIQNVSDMFSTLESARRYSWGDKIKLVMKLLISGVYRKVRISEER